MSTRRQLMGLHGEWLLDLTVSGQVFRFATAPVSVQTNAGVTYRYSEGLAEQVLGVSAQGSSDLSAPVRLDASEAWDALIANFATIERSKSTLRRWFPGQTIEQARVVVDGMVSGFTYGAPHESITFAIIRKIRDQSRRLPSSGMVVDSKTWPVRAGWSLDEKVLGAYYPIIIGAPGTPAGATSTNASAATDGLLVETAGAANTDRLLVAGHQVEAATVQVWDYTDDATPQSALLAVAETTDLVGRVISYVSLGTAFTPVAESGRVYHVGWPLVSGGGYRDPSSGGLMRGAGQVLQWLVERWTDAPFDRRRASSALARLDTFKLDTFLNEPIDPMEFINSLLEFLPAEPRQGPDGLWFFTRPANIQRGDAVASLSADSGAIQRESLIQIAAQELINEVTVEYAPDRATGRYRRRITVAGDNYSRPDEFQAEGSFVEDVRILGSYRAKLSTDTYGRQPTTLQVDHVWDRSTAVLIARSIIEQQALPRRYVDYSGGSELEAFELGAIVRLADSEVGLDDELAVILDIEVGGPSVLVSFELVDDPVTLRRATL